MRTRDARRDGKGGIKRRGLVERIVKDAREVIGQKENGIDSGAGLLEPDYLKVSERDQEENKENLMEIEVVTGKPSDQRKALQVLD